MKKFSFSLDKLLSYKRKLFDLERAKLIELNALLSQQQMKKDKQVQSYLSGAAQYKEKAKTGLNVTEISVHKNYLREMERMIERTEREIQDTLSKIEKKKEELVQAKTEIRSIERLREKRMEEHQKKETKEQELFIEEFVSASNSANNS